jgi:hypothetical protein
MFSRCRQLAEAYPPRRWLGAGGARDAADLQAAHRAGASGWLTATALIDAITLPQAAAIRSG